MKRNKLTNMVLTIGGKIHPLMGPVFIIRSHAQMDHSKCDMCVGSNRGEIETEIRTNLKRFEGVCLRHDLMLHSKPTQETDDVVAEYQAEVLTNFMSGISKPSWMPAKIYTRLVERAKRLARVQAEAVVYDFMIPIIEQRAEEQNALADKLIAEIAAERAKGQS